MLAAHGVPFVEAHELMRPLSRYHVEYGDCVHWCMPGPMRVVNDLLLTYMDARLRTSFV